MPGADGIDEVADGPVLGLRASVVGRLVARSQLADQARGAAAFRRPGCDRREPCGDLRRGTVAMLIGLQRRQRVGEQAYVRLAARNWRACSAGEAASSDGCYAGRWIR